LFLILYGLFGGYRVSKSKMCRWKKGKGDPWLPLGLAFILVLPFLFHGFFLLYYQHTMVKRFQRDRFFHGRTFKKEHSEQKVILCMGGSSTEGSPFEPNWPYDYPRQLERALAEMNIDVVVANAGIISTNSQFALEHMQSVLEALKPDVVTINYMNNDSRGSLAESLLSLVQKIGFFYYTDKFETLHSENIHKLVRLVRSHGARCVFILEPHFNYIYFNKDPFPKMRRLINEIAYQEGAVVVDPNPIFKQEKDRPLFIDHNVHLTRFGTELLAEILALHIRNLFTIPMSKRDD